MRISKPKERWFEVPEDPDEARIKIKHLSPGERQDIFDKVFLQEIEYETGEQGKMIPKMKQVTDRKTDREETLVKAVVDWEYFYDENGKPLECNVENIIRASREIEGFAEHVSECRQVLDSDIAEEEKELEKNL
jgi:hypothetical protein